MPDIAPIRSAAADAAAFLRREYVDMLAAAYLRYTGLPPDMVELVEQTSPDGLTKAWYFRVKPECLPKRN